MSEVVSIADILAAKKTYTPTTWHDKVVDPEGDNSHPGTKFTATRGNKLERATEDNTERLNQQADYLEESDRTTKGLRFEFLLLKASVASGLTSNMLVENFETGDSVTLTAGVYSPDLQKIYLP